MLGMEARVKLEIRVELCSSKISLYVNPSTLTSTFNWKQILSAQSSSDSCLVEISFELKSHDETRIDPK